MKSNNLYKAKVGIFEYNAEDYYCIASSYQEAAQIFEKQLNDYHIRFIELVSNKFINDDTATTKSKDSEA